MAKKRVSEIMPRPRHIFILEDDPDIGFVLNLFLSSEGFEVEVFSTISAIEAKWHNCLPDLFLMDVRLPDGDGFEVCKEIKQDCLAKNIPVVMMSAHLSEGEEDPIADDFIAKPFDLQDMVTRLNTFLAVAG